MSGLWWIDIEKEPNRSIERRVSCITEDAAGQRSWVMRGRIRSEDGYVNDKRCMSVCCEEGEKSAVV